ASLAKSQLGIRTLQGCPTSNLGGRRLVEFRNFRHLVARNIDGCTLHAGTVDIEIYDAVVVKFMPMRIRKPSRPGITAMAVDRTPEKGDAIPQLAIKFLESASQFKHTRVPGDVVGRAVEPGAIVCTNECELRFLALQLNRRQSNLPPAFECVRHERCTH